MHPIAAAGKSVVSAVYHRNKGSIEVCRNLIPFGLYETCQAAIHMDIVVVLRHETKDAGARP
jgi:hypothetical protein